MINIRCKSKWDIERSHRYKKEKQLYVDKFDNLIKWLNKFLKNHKLKSTIRRMENPKILNLLNE